MEDIHATPEGTTPELDTSKDEQAFIASATEALNRALGKQEGRQDEPAQESLEAAAKSEEDKQKQLEEPVKDERPKNLIEAKKGEEKWELPEDAMVVLKTKTGKMAEIPLSELKNDYWGKAEVSRRMTEIQKLKSELAAPREFLERLQDKSINGFERVYMLLNDLGTMEPSLREDIRAFAQQLINPPEGGAQELNNKVEKAQLAREKAEYQKGKHADTVYSFLNSKSTEIAESLSMSHDELIGLAHTLSEQGKLPAVTDMQTAQEAMNVLGSAARADRVLTALETVDPELLKNEELARDLFGIYQSNPSLSMDDLVGKAKKLAGKSNKPATSKVSAKLDEKLEKKQKQTPPQQQQELRQWGRSELPKTYDPREEAMYRLGLN